ncbi:MAG: hypothetical protein COS39_00450 [Hydrogenophilales bacterium CG03_land_8_20_14_0_80_62_28]|nr:CHAD domain-containing protein [Betaproteobacteria bacterium]OIO77746.1 MAG: hypothetical protein AUJ86_07905 [Hydrogenophilaceae bacterium CG1_02_62_390]PIV24726.1 MAG: hypothetical protein COS39_00450 [Hydrogenophilales bacterium CG03_land_8_20_14_0_80_62_28]PIW38500.1 MAG: hypothetical protein COW23_06090 [Hydrogenophilales bacterium CG15_BIG_FIL_POST_REV_8_21_14_020_62_31]PIW71251.1 MAG: hypothetical protein COW07_08970 [Hydrogenophilales bacterium CG12_big_fil_rev_8_21_14_0_65_61_21]PI
MALEVELKLAIAPDDATRLRRHPLLRALKPLRHKLYGIYFDTPQFDLYRQRSAIRLRREGYHWVQTLKLDGGDSAALSSRPEWEARTTGNQPDLDILPKAARQQLPPDLATRLRPIFITDIRRTVWLLERPEGVVEIALDAGWIRVGEAELPISELELEIKSGDSGLLIDIALELLTAAPMLPEYRSKALRGYELAGVWQQMPAKTGPVTMADQPSAAEAWRRLLLAGLTQLSRNLPGLLSGHEPEYGHQMRIAVQRIETVLRLGRRIGLARPDWLSELRWLMAELAPARDWDVMVTETLADCRAALPDGNRLDALIAVADARRTAARERARAAATEPRTTRLLLTMTKDLMPERSGGVKLANWAGESLDRRLRQFRKLARQYDRLNAAGRHRLRIATKRLRYAGEAYAPRYGDQANDYLARMARLQDSLGAANDAAVAQGLLVELTAQDKTLAQAASLAEGFMIGVTIGQARRLAKLTSAALAARPFWRRTKKK